MTVTDSLRPLIARLRREIGDEDEPMWTEAQIADALESFQSVVRYARLNALETRLPNGTVRYFEFESGVGWWETDAQIVTGSWSVVTPETWDWVRGRATFATHQVSALYISGKYYDYYGAAELLIDQTIAKIKARAIDRTDRDSSLKRSQQIDTLTELKRSLCARRPAGTAQMVRAD